MCKCVTEGQGWVGCQRDSQGKGKNLVVYVTPPASCGIVLIQRFLPLPSLGGVGGPINSSQQLTEQLEHAMKLICLNVPP